MVGLFSFLFAVLVLFSAPLKADDCHPLGEPSIAYDKGLLSVPLDYSSTKSSKIELYWERFHASKQPSRGAVFFLPGGPFPHFLFHGKNSAYQWPDLFPDYDMYFWDYRGFSCSSKVETVKELEKTSPFYDIPTFARDFHALKENLVGKEKVIIFGGSFGGILGSQILFDFPDDVEKAILFSSDVHTDWWYTSLLQVKQIIEKVIPDQFPSFKSDWKNFLEILDLKKLVLFSGTPKEVTLNRELLTIDLWFTGQSIALQEQFPGLIKAANEGKLTELETLHKTFYLGFSEPSLVPQLKSAVFGLYVCNTYFSRATRQKLIKNPFGTGDLSLLGLINYFDRYCAQYDSFSENSFDLQNKIVPINVPVLYWVGDRDWFDPAIAEKNMKKFGPKVDAHVMKDWSHDLGKDPVVGLKEITNLIRNFLK